MIGMFINFHTNILYLKLKTFLLFNCKIAKLEVHFFFVQKTSIILVLLNKIKCIYPGSQSTR